MSEYFEISGVRLECVHPSAGAHCRGSQRSVVPDVRADVEHRHAGVEQVEESPRRLRLVMAAKQEITVQAAVGCGKPESASSVTHAIGSLVPKLPIRRIDDASIQAAID